MPFLPNSSLYLKKLSSEYQLYACGNFFRKSSILKEIAILGQPPSGGWSEFHFSWFSFSAQTMVNIKMTK